MKPIFLTFICVSALVLAIQHDTRFLSKVDKLATSGLVVSDILN